MHHLQVGNVIAHEHHLVVLQAVLRDKLLVGLDFHSRSEIDVLHAQSFVAHAYRFYLTAGDDGYAQTHLHSQLYGIAVLDVHRSQWRSVDSQRNGLR